MLIALQEYKLRVSTVFTYSLTNLTDLMVRASQQAVCDTSSQVCYQARNRSRVSGSLEE